MNRVALRALISDHPLEEGFFADNLAICLVSYFEEHMDKPANAEVDESGWTVWAIEKTNKVLDSLTDELLQKIALDASVVGDAQRAAFSSGEQYKAALTLLREFINLCAIGDVDENTEAYGWGDLIKQAKAMTGVK